MIVVRMCVSYMFLTTCRVCTYICTYMYMYIPTCVHVQNIKIIIGDVGFVDSN